MFYREQLHVMQEHCRFGAPAAFMWKHFVCSLHRLVSFLILVDFKEERVENKHLQSNFHIC